MSQAAQVISLLGGSAGQPVVAEALAGAAGIIPGMLVEKSGATVVVHGSAGENALPMFAQTNKATGGTIDTAYANAETVNFGTYHTGQKVNALVAAAAAAITVGDALVSAGDGTLALLSVSASTSQAQRDSIVAYADVAVDNSGGGTSVRIAVTIA